MCFGYNCKTDLVNHFCLMKSLYFWGRSPIYSDLEPINVNILLDNTFFGSGILGTYKIYVVFDRLAHTKSSLKSACYCYIVFISGIT